MKGGDTPAVNGFYFENFILQGFCRLICGAAPGGAVNETDLKSNSRSYRGRDELTGI